jgi:NitT/TauT family transport system ATP-binding protein
MDAPGAILDVLHLSKLYESGERTVHAVADLSFSVARGRFVCIVGPSGCGKTTLLKCVAGLLPPSGGSVVFQGTTVREPPARLALVSQDYSQSLLPWMSVRGNVLLPLRHKVRDRRRRKQLVESAVTAVGLTRFLNHYPWQLSGGMQQRVAIARALAYQPDLLLMDEPFAAVDAQVRADLEDLILEVSARFGITVLFVTHDIDEAAYLGDEILVLSSSPARIIESIQVELPRPRHQVWTKELPQFAHLRSRVFCLIKPRPESESGSVPRAAVDGSQRLRPLLAPEPSLSRDVTRR